MKLIIDIDDDIYNFIKEVDDENSVITGGLYGAVCNGTPLDDALDMIRAEIDKQSQMHLDGDLYIKNSDVKKILAKYEGDNL